MPTKLENELHMLAEFIEEQVAKITGVSRKMQDKIYDVTKNAVLNFELESGHFVPTQDFNSRLLSLERRINTILTGKEYANSIKDFLSSFDEIQERTAYLHKTYNELKVEVSKLKPARQYIYNQAKYNLTEALAPQYIQPMQHLLMLQITSSASIKDGLEMLETWNKGKLRPVTGESIPDLERYATQIARDTAYSVGRTTNDIIRDEYGFDGFVYVGDIIEDTRPLCHYLISLGREIAYSELPTLINKYPQGLYPETNETNFTSKCGGYNCRHQAFPVMLKKNKK